MRKSVIAVVAILLLAGGIVWLSRNKAAAPDNTATPSNATPSMETPTPSSATTPTSTTAPIPTTPASAANDLVMPLSRAGERTTKKFYGTFVTPKNSPVSPERFTGYHNGLDFETFAEEKDADVTVHAICTGPLLVKRTASGYGGVAVQKCTIKNEVVTVIYRHMRLASISTAVNAQLKAGDVLGVLGTGYSKETDGERKHLHLGIHKGASVNIAGYVQTKAALAGWIDPQSVLGFQL